ncbi:MAG: hypothetical protein H6Q59_669 [Firmicutes bacterium]|nr:hypothetical protein [Bacillota bacterium]
MNEKAAIMKNEIRVVANHRALMISKWILSFALLFVALYLGILRFPISPLYILLFLIFLPPILSSAAKDYSKKSQNKVLLAIVQDDPFLLNTIKTKYKYTKLRYITNSASYLVSLFMISLWQYNYSHQYYLADYLKSIPITLLASSLMIRLLVILLYRLKLPYDLSNNKVG